MGHIEQQEAGADSGGRHKQNRPAPASVSNPADKRRSQKLATGIAAEQQPDVFGGDARVALCPKGEKRHQYAVGQSGHEEKQHGNARRPGQVPDQHPFADRMFERKVTSSLHPTVRGPIYNAIGHRTNAVDDVNAYGRKQAKRYRYLLHTTH